MAESEQRVIHTLQELLMQREQEIARLRGALSKYADHKLWCCMDHISPDCPFCSTEDFIVYDGEGSDVPGWIVAEEALKGGEA